MEMERINDNTIRVLVANEDLNERGITVLDLLSNQKDVESFFYSILEEVDVDHQFQNDEAVTFQVLPNRNGLELFISKNTEMLDGDLPGTTDEVSEYIKKQLSQSDQDNSTSPTGKASDSLDSISEDPIGPIKSVIVKLNDVEDFIQISQMLWLEGATSSLFRYQGAYYLELLFFVNELSEASLKNDVALLLEYGKQSQFDADFLVEHGKVIIAGHALETARKYFK